MAGMKGRCAGCGKVGSVTAVRKHVLGCERFVASSQEDPEVEYARWAAQGRSSDARAARIEALIAGNEAKLSAATSRWQTPPEVWD